MKYLLILLLLSGCTTTKTVMPELPDSLRYACKNLIPIGQDAKLSDLIQAVNENYTRHHECAAQVDAYIDWYNKQQAIYRK